MITIKMHQQAFITGGDYQLPDEDGLPTIYGMTGVWYMAYGSDADDRDYCVCWGTLPGWDGEDEGDACDWEHPAAVVRLAPWADVTAQAVLVWPDAGLSG